MKILVAIDDSKFSQAAVQALIAQIPPSNAEVRVVHVVEPITVASPPQMAAGYAPELAELVKEGRTLVEQTAQTLRAAGFKVDAAVEKGDVREKILESAGDWGASLIVLGSHGHRGVRRFLLGSVAESVARHAACSVEIVRLPARQ
ncbi:MAG TPA: universal stress protein [Terriglobia bacterium]|nr:universal stress protein [Terriglobia bacterium]